MAEGGSGLPATPAQTPGLPENSDLLVFAGWNGIDTKPPRPGVADNMCAWCDNLMPLGENNIRAIPDCAVNALYTGSAGNPIIHFDFFGVFPAGPGSGPSACIFLADGSAIAVATFTGATTTIAPAGTFSAPANTAIATRQFGTQYLLIATEQAQSAYWIWDGSLLYGSGTIGPEVDITDGGSGYTSTPTITALGGSGSGATFSSTIFDGAVDTITVTNPGTGWAVGDPQQVVLLFSGGGGGTSAHGTATVVNGAIVSVQIQNAGNGFTSIPTVTVTDVGGGSGANIIVSGLQGGSITSVEVIDCGHNYITPVLTVSGGGGSSAQLGAVINNGVITAVTMVNVGSGYVEQPVVDFISTSGSGATGIPILSAGTITGVNFGQGVGHGFTGVGYTSPVIVAFTGGGGPASATALLMPFGIQGNAIEVYQSRVWISTTLRKVKIFFTAPGSALDFGPDDGGGVFPATDSVLRYQWSSLVQSNGFLYLIGDSSVNYISGVTTSGSPAITTFSNLNVDPQIGSPWRDSVQVYSRAIIIGNPFGIHAIYGGAVQKISTPLDGVFNTGNTNNTLNGPSSSVAEVFGVHVLLFLMPIIDPITGNPRNCLFMWDGKRWWTASQRVNFTKIATEEWGSTINTYGTDGVSIYRLFFQASATQTKTLQSKLYMRPSINVTKKGMQMYAFFQSNTIESTTLNFTVDTEAGSTAITQGAFVAPSHATRFARSNTGDSYGHSMGFTMTSNSIDFTLINITLLVQNRRLKV